LLKVSELLESDDFLLWIDLVLLARQRVMWLISQHNFVEDFRRVVDESDLV